MRALNVDQEAFVNQRQVVEEEKRLRVDNQPYATSGIKLQEAAFSNYANQHPTIGSEADLDAAKLEDVRRFHQTFYAPNNAVLVIVGDFQPKQTRELIARYFGDIPRQPLPNRPDLAEPAQSAERRLTVDDRLARVPALEIAWHGPSLSNPDQYAMDLLADILFSGEDSRAYQQLVKGKQIALSINGNMNEERGPSLFTVSAVYRPNVDPAQMEQAIYALINEIKQSPPTADEVNRAKTRLRANRYRGFSIFGLESDLGRAIQIADYATLQNDANLINTEMSKYMAVTPAQIQAVALKYFRSENRTVVIVRPGAGGKQTAGGSR